MLGSSRLTVAHTLRLVRSSPTLSAYDSRRAVDPGLLKMVTDSTNSELPSSYVSVCTWSTYAVWQMLVVFEPQFWLAVALVMPS